MTTTPYGDNTALIVSRFFAELHYQHRIILSTVSDIERGYEIDASSDDIRRLVNKKTSAYDEIGQIGKRFHDYTYHLNKIITSLEQSLKAARNDLSEAHKCVDRLNIIAEPSSDNTNSTPYTVIECLCKFIPQHIIDLGTQIKYITDALDVANKNAQDVYKARIAFYSLQYKHR